MAKLERRPFDFRPMPRTAARLAANSEKILDDTVFKGMKGHDRKPATRLEYVFRRASAAISSSSSSLTKIRRAWNVRVAG